MSKYIETEITEYADWKFSTKNGLIKTEDLENGKKDLAHRVSEKLSDFITYRQEYPEDGASLVFYNLDVIVLSRTRFNELKEIEANYLKLCN